MEKEIQLKESYTIERLNERTTMKRVCLMTLEKERKERVGFICSFSTSLLAREGNELWHCNNSTWRGKTLFIVVKA
jgi:hypothetical protein